MILYSFVNRLKQPSQWLLEQQWTQWCLVGSAALLAFVLLVKITRRRRRQLAGFGNLGHIPDRSFDGDIAPARPIDVVVAGGGGRSGTAWTDPTELLSHPEISIRQLRREIFKRDQAEARLEHQIEELQIANEQLRQQVADHKETCAYFENKVAELTAANEMLTISASGNTTEAEAKEPPTARKESIAPETSEKKDQKQCRKCRKHKPLTEFHKNASSHDGLARWCKKCKTKAAKEARQKRAEARRSGEQPGDMCADAPLCVLHHRQTDRVKTARRRAGHAAYKVPEARQTEHRSHRFRSQLSSPGLRCPRRQKQREQGSTGSTNAKPD